MVQIYKDGPITHTFIVVCTRRIIWHRFQAIDFALRVLVTFWCSPWTRVDVEDIMFDHGVVGAEMVMVAGKYRLVFFRSLKFIYFY